MKLKGILNDVFRVKKPKEVNKLYLKWLRYLKNNKLFDEYIVFMNFVYGGDSKYPIPQDYEELETLATRLKRCGYIDVGNTFIRVDWKSVFLKFVEESVKWWDFRTKMKYLFTK